MKLTKLTISLVIIAGIILYNVALPDRCKATISPSVK